MTNWRGPGVPGGAAAQRLRIRPWRDPRLLIGVLLVLGATVLGAQVAAAHDDSVAYWSLAGAVKAGDPVSDDALRVTHVRLSAGAEERYLRADEQFPAPLAELVWAHDVDAGALLARSAVAPRQAAERSQLPLSVAAGAFPTDLAPGDLVDVWVGPGPGDEADETSVRVLESVRVAQSRDDAAAIGGSSARTILVDVDASELRGQVVSTVAAGHVTIVRVFSWTS